MSLPEKSDHLRIETNPDHIELNFSEYNSLQFRSKNISYSKLTGNVTSKHHFDKINIIHSNLQELKAENVDFYNSDIKDCAISDCLFHYCQFNEAAHINNYVNNTKFENCTFNQTSITDSEFRDSHFYDCDFTNVIISSSRFTDCYFTRCKTSNKIIESSLLFDCVFEEITIQPETITENFGLRADALINSQIRFKSPEGDIKLVSPSEFYTKDIFRNLSPIESFLFHYFQTPPILLEGSDDIDKTFDFGTWLDLSKNPNRFRMLIERYHEFIMHEYEYDRAPFWMILKFHKMTGELSQSIDPAKLEVYRSILGVHMSLSRMVELYLELTEYLMRKYIEEQEINLLVVGPVEKAYYLEHLAVIFEGRNLTIKRIVKHNSPNELLVGWEHVRDMLPLITLFLATRVKFGIQKQVMTQSFKNYLSSKELPDFTASPSPSKAYDILKTEFGFDKQVNNYLFKLKAMLPGNLLFDLQIELRTNILGKVKKILLDILPHLALKASNDL
jgi:hypothetical protein